ncbi:MULTISPECIES: TerC family protein [Leptospira]|uniref:Integral membrane protein TerC family protein n=1 Tax=Leptospira borgpetersenii serovar Ballum TaxID=280505 RepID=A0A0E3B4D3_LEPBO|nr:MULTISPECIES: TerC family protein [Leptospira]EMO11061.1 integral membrane protein TerC family protein [Leptospira borgpetersenii str. Noumea 25]ALO24813.1 integral membrane protein TerC family protein [Leptospira borgpetersenii serovar Ballum]ANG99889.1 Integral membrane protein TerC family protein [Leptospira borgpetersenii str. 4E]EKR02107.1 integral membrane protein TerC family protein [Leptospira borgpetersenii serovar Castellonis str. 200801910]EMK14318.1 integral membrane protein Ter
MELLTLDKVVAILTLTLMEIVLGIDNIVFLSIVSGKLPKNKQNQARNLGLTLALGFRIGLLFAVSWIASLTAPLVTIADFAISGRDLIMLGGGLFLIAKSTSEIHGKVEGIEEEMPKKEKISFWGVILQLILLDIIFSVDSIVTAVGLSGQFQVMVAAVVLSMIVMLVFSGTVSDFINEHPTMKVLALSFLIMIGAMLFADGLHFHIPKGYVYFSMAFSLGVELINMRIRKANSKRQ